MRIPPKPPSTTAVAALEQAVKQAQSAPKPATPAALGNGKDHWGVTADDTSKPKR